MYKLALKMYDIHVLQEELQLLLQEEYKRNTTNGN
ncbi:Uncharacterised protein [Yersinia mollaretii]|nr:Uncharacterised protein [Yersinia mollaretii]